jgi:predicted acetyltransferase
VVRAVRRKRVGYDVARRLFAEFLGPWEIGFQAHNAGTPQFWRRVVTDTVGTMWREELRAVPGKPHIPDDHFLLFTA